ncbi:hypothetical protein EXU48_13425 [Occultella glacieicola]|uniref:Polyketide cyclase n=1 Tax=Occultella glacieicola TaxID=2518684 RepID=A0ABY2E1Q4_9MICO|nr:hypothetical protein [Occultella glacieicola]TDE92544.1 hypothetical protein EXU48_13425 [Occultella glacieicola]
MPRYSLVQVREALESSWEPATAYLEAHQPGNPSLGQCYPTSRVLQLLFPEFEIVEGQVWTGEQEEKHFWNLLPTELGVVHIDLTWQQFAHGSVVRHWRARDRDGLDDGADTVRRVDRLLESVHAHLRSERQGHP